MIKTAEAGHEASMEGVDLAFALIGSGGDGDAAPSGEARTSDVRAMVSRHADFIWRSLRRLGLPSDLCGDATQRVFLVATRRVRDIAPGAERAFLFKTALRIASSERRTLARRREVLTDEVDTTILDPAPSTEDLVDQRRARVLLEEILEGMALDERAVFVLFELEGMTTAEISALLELPMGTVGSRLRRAREHFQGALKRRRASQSAMGGAR